MNTKLLIIFACAIMCVCGCELGTDRVYMEMYEAMNANSEVIESGIKERIRAMEEAVKRKPDYKALIVASHEIEELTADFYNFVDDLDKQLDKRVFKAINDDEIKGKIVTHRQKIINVLKHISGNRTLGIRQEEIRGLTDLHLFPNGNLPLINGKLFDEYSFENQSIACNKAILAKQKNDALMLAKITVNYLAGKTGTTICTFDKAMVASSPKTNFIIKGKTFETDIFLYYPRPTPRMKQTIKVDGIELPVKNGFAIYATTPTVYGEHTYDVEISVINPFNHKSETYRRTFSFEVGERCY